MDISTALDQLDPKNDEHWTKTGLPVMGAVEVLVGDTNITRAEVTEARPDFNRATAQNLKPDSTSTEDPDKAKKKRDKEMKKARKVEAKRKKTAADKLEKEQGAAAKKARDKKDREKAKIKAAKKAEKANAKKRKKGDPDIIIVGYDYPARRVKAIAKAVRKSHPKAHIHVQCAHPIFNGPAEDDQDEADVLNDDNLQCVQKRAGAYMHGARFQALNASHLYLGERVIPDEDKERVIGQIIKRK